MVGGGTPTNGENAPDKGGDVYNLKLNPTGNPISIYLVTPGSSQSTQLREEKPVGYIPSTSIFESFKKMLK